MRNEHFHQPKLLLGLLGIETPQTREVGSGSVRASDSTDRDRVGYNCKNYRNGRSRVLDRTRFYRANYCDHMGIEPNQFGRHLPKPIDLSLKEPRLKVHITALRIAKIFKTLQESPRLRKIGTIGEKSYAR